MHLLILLVTVSGLLDGCEIGQVCYKCRGLVNTCNNGSYFYTTADGCISYVMNSTTKLSAHYTPDNTRCYPYTCSNNLYFQDSTRFVIRKTCNPDCTNFTLTQYQNKAVLAIPYSSTVKSIGQCFEDCFDIVGCYAFSYGYSVCSLYTSCGTSCALFNLYGTTVYTRTCHEETDCNVPDGTDNGEVNTPSGTTANNVAVYECFVGYSLAGSSTRTCQNDGQWSGSAAVCSPIDCGFLTAPTNGAINTSTGTLYSNQTVYSCSVGYMLIGNSTRMCQSNGMWSGSPPSCDSVDCGILTSPANGYVQNPIATTYTELASYFCSTGYYILGPSERTCQSDGTWNGTSSTCQPVDCGIPASPSNGAVAVHNGTKYTTMAIFSCNTGYMLYGESEAVCNSSGVWNSSIPACYIIDCGSTTAPVDGTVQYPAGTTYGETATFQCDTGYYLSHLNNRTCLSNGVWSMTTPQCVANGTTVPGPTRLYIAPCICYPNKTFTGLTQEEIIQLLTESIRIEPNSTALAQNRLKCAEDPRMSSRIIGSAGAGIIATVFGILISLDVFTLCQKLGHVKTLNLKGHTNEFTTTGSKDMSPEPTKGNIELAC